MILFKFKYMYFNYPSFFPFQELDEIKPYPAEILQGVLYLGNWRQGNAPYVQKDLKIKAHINCCVEAETLYVTFYVVLKT